MSEGKPEKPVDEKNKKKEPDDEKRWWEGPTAAIVLVALVGVIGVMLYLEYGDGLPVEGCRSMLAVIFSIGTITMAFCLMLGAFLGRDDDDTKERFGLALQVLTPLFGIMGTILGFYFGTSQGEVKSGPLTIVDVMVNKPSVIAGESFPVTILVDGGHGPWDYTLTFANNVLPAIKKKVNTQHLRESIEIPAEKTGQLGVTVQVTDSAGASAKAEKKVGEWVTIERPATSATAAPEPPTDDSKKKKPNEGGGPQGKKAKEPCETTSEPTTPKGPAPEPPK